VAASGKRERQFRVGSAIPEFSGAAAQIASADYLAMRLPASGVADQPALRIPPSMAAHPFRSPSLGGPGRLRLQPPPAVVVGMAPVPQTIGPPMALAATLRCSARRLPRPDPRLRLKPTAALRIGEHKNPGADPTQLRPPRSRRWGGTSSPLGYSSLAQACARLSAGPPGRSRGRSQRAEIRLPPDFHAL